MSFTVNCATTFVDFQEWTLDTPQEIQQAYTDEMNAFRAPYEAAGQVSEAIITINNDGFTVITRQWDTAEHAQEMTNFVNGTLHTKYSRPQMIVDISPI